jgi:hypothetical protein
VEQAIANDEDRWAVAQLLHAGTFGTNFLLDCFKSGVVQQIADEAVARHAGSDYLSRESYALGYLADGDGLPLDSKVLVLNALARNDEAARLALTEPVDPIEIMDRFGTHQTFTNPQDLLFYGVYEDDGAALGEMWASGVDGLIENGEHGRAADYTERLAHELIQIERDNWDDARPASGDDMRGIADGLARTLSDHYIDDLHDSAASGETGPDWDSDPGTQHGDGELGMSTDTGALRYSTDQLRDLVQGLMSRDLATDRFLDGVAQHQAIEIAGGVGTSDTGWAERIGNFNGILTSANAVDRVDGMEEAVARHERIFGALDGVMGAIPFTEPLGTIASQGLEAIDSHLAPDGSYAALMQENARFSDQMFVNQDAAIVTGFYERGLLGDERDIAASLTDLRGDDELVEALYEPNAPVPFIENGHLIPYGDMTSDQRQLFDAWIDKDEGARAQFYEALKNARDGLNSRD